MSWWDYVQRHAKGDDQKQIAAKISVDQSTVSRWRTSAGKAENVAGFARAYGRPVLEAFVAAGFLTEAEAKVRPVGTPDYSQLSNDQLLELVRERMRDERGVEHDDGSAANQAPESGPADQPDTPPVRLAPAASKQKGASRGRFLRRAQDEDAEAPDPPAPDD